MTSEEMFISKAYSLGLTPRMIILKIQCQLS